MLFVLDVIGVCPVWAGVSRLKDSHDSVEEHIPEIPPGAVQLPRGLLSDHGKNRIASQRIEVCRGDQPQSVARAE